MENQPACLPLPVNIKRMLYLLLSTAITQSAAQTKAWILLGTKVTDGLKRRAVKLELGRRER